jgi:hypothetical protein
VGACFDHEATFRRQEADEAGQPGLRRVLITENPKPVTHHQNQIETLARGQVVEALDKVLRRADGPLAMVTQPVADLDAKASDLLIAVLQVREVPANAAAVVKDRRSCRQAEFA